MKDGLPRKAHAIEGEPEDPESWKLPHHTAALARMMRRQQEMTAEGLHRTVDWERMAAAVAAISPGGYRGQRVQASAEQTIAAARHLAEHYRAAGRPVPDTLQAII